MLELTVVGGGAEHGPWHIIYSLLFFVKKQFLNIYLHNIAPHPLSSLPLHPSNQNKSETPTKKITRIILKNITGELLENKTFYCSEIYN